jgi:hypothetical protein
MLDTNWLIEAIEKTEEEISKHRAAIVITCDEHCWCWYLETAQSYLEVALHKETKESE